MEDQVQRLVDKAWQKYEQIPPNRRLLIGIAGIPGSGKTTLAQIVTQRLQALAEKSRPSSPPTAVSMAMDGFHLTRAELDAMPDPVNAHARRGAPFTFNPRKFFDLVSALHEPPTAPILAPTFDHAVKDPKEDDLCIPDTARIVIIEGLYLALDEPLWRDARALFDEMWFVEVDMDVSKQRLRERHFRAGIVETLEDGERRAVENDIPNGHEILAKRLPIDEIIYSREDGTWVHK